MKKSTGQPTQVSENILVRDFQEDCPLQKIVPDITYLPFGQSMMYLSSIMDLFNGGIVACSIDPVQVAWQFTKGVVLNSDQESVNIHIF